MEITCKYLDIKSGEKNQVLYNILILKMKSLDPGIFQDGVSNTGATGQLPRTKPSPSHSFYVGGGTIKKLS